MIINFVGLFGPSGSGEVSDETHLADSLESLGHTVRRIPRDEWREYVIEFPNGKYQGVPQDLTADINIVAKWPHFYDGTFIKRLKQEAHSPVFYWCWDSVDLGIEWHREMARAADLYLSGELGRAGEFRANGIRFYYFQMDIVDGRIQFGMPPPTLGGYKYDVTYLGSCDNQNGRVDLLKEINARIPIHVFGPGDWRGAGFENAHAPVFGAEANKVMAESKIVLGTSCDPHLAGYWSNRVGRVLANRSFFLVQYTPMMESFLHDWVHYYSTAAEAIEKIDDILDNASKYRERAEYSRELWRSNQKAKDLCILIERYRKENYGQLWILP